MKNFTSFLALLAISFSSFAITPNVQLKKSEIKFDSNLKENTVVNFHNIRPLTAEQKAKLPSLNSIKKSNAAHKSVSENTTEWTKLDGARAKDPFLTTVGYLMPEIYNVDLYQNKADETYFAVENPLKYSKYNGIEILSTSSSPKYFLASDNTMEIFTEDEDLVYAYPVEVATINSSYQSSFGGTTVQFVNVAGLNIQQEGKDKDKNNYGYFDNNVITFPAGTMYVYIDGEAAGEYTDDFSIALPEGKLYATSIYPALAVLNDAGTQITDYDFATCTTGDNDYMIYFYNVAGDVENVALAFVPTYCLPSEETYQLATNYVIDGDTESSYYIMKPKTLLDYIFSQYGSEEVTHLAYSMVTFAYDDEGNYIPNSGSVVQLMHQPDESAYYKSIGKGKFTDGFFSFLFNSTEELSAEVEIEESVFDEDKGIIRIVNPFNNIYTNYVDATHDHYIYMNVKEQEGYPICIHPSATGLNIGYGDAMVTSLSYYSMFYDYSSVADQITATYDEDTNTITFPQYSLSMAFPVLYRGEWLTSNRLGDFKLQLPASYSPSGVKDIISDDNDNAPIEYFNLQGIKIVNPTPGELIIKRQGSRTTKFTVK